MTSRRPLAERAADAALAAVSRALDVYAAALRLTARARRTHPLRRRRVAAHLTSHDPGHWCPRCDTFSAVVTTFALSEAARPQGAVRVIACACGWGETR